MEDHAEVGLLSQQDQCISDAEYDPYPRYYRAAFAFSAFLCPHPLRHSLRSAFPTGGIRVYRVPRWV